MRVSSKVFAVESLEDYYKSCVETVMALKWRLQRRCNATVAGKNHMTRCVKHVPA